jgi:hypothetical protein
MLTGPKRAVSGPNGAAPVEPGHRGQLARLIRERPVFVNLAACLNWGDRGGASKRHDLREYINICGVFHGRDGGLQACALDPELADISDP